MADVFSTCEMPGYLYVHKEEIPQTPQTYKLHGHTLDSCTPDKDIWDFTLG